jgi:hypothetical protein
MYQQVLLCLIENAPPSMDPHHLRAMTAKQFLYFTNLIRLFSLRCTYVFDHDWDIGILASDQPHRDLIYKRLSHMCDLLGFASGTSKSQISIELSHLSCIMRDMSLDISSV